jgi:hypothetical protein
MAYYNLMILKALKSIFPLKTLIIICFKNDNKRAERNGSYISKEIRDNDGHHNDRVVFHTHLGSSMLC